MNLGDTPTVVSTNYHSDKIATTTNSLTTTNSPLTYIVKAPHYISGPKPVCSYHHYSEAGRPADPSIT